MTKKNAGPDKKLQGVESLLSSLEYKIQQMESHNLSLSDAMQGFQEGIELVYSAQAQLKEAEQVIAVLSRKSDATNIDIDETLRRE
ncbi:exodeoxyribonuclease VII small subunit [Halieaceae bacterium IMCC8485]|jgi:exodeoxyribonuclease VII small subunit|uniref:Exodeoxyribonuclease 7 small subunit n=1 Tax=Candidatus Seongchinamella marina TaxID=2518990 RepID=A0ABT3T0H4_9GAMM|nr:exodeoxyribonuclease VII small subunit [Candidatus Seongchinamella marina]MCX2975675.1 exodeoxyribonuclease VII small subunit [Candidatus Seongchinamella marina]